MNQHSWPALNSQAGHSFLNSGGHFFTSQQGLWSPFFFTILEIKKKHLPFYMGRYGSPALLIAVDRLDRRSQKLGHLPLGLFQFFPEMFEFRTVHMRSHSFCYYGANVKDQCLSATWWHRLSRKILSISIKCLK